MSRIYRYEEIAPADQRDVDKPPIEDPLLSSRGEIEKLFLDGYVEGAFLYGSTIFNKEDECSDIDAFIAVREFNPETAEALRALVENLTKKFGIPVNLTTYTSSQLKLGQHSLRRGYLATMQEQAGMRPDLIVGTNPLMYIKPLEKDLLLDVNEYITMQERQVIIDYIHNMRHSPEASLELALNMPHRMGRKTINALELEGKISVGTLADMSKEAISAAVDKVYGKKDNAITLLKDDLRIDLQTYVDFVRHVKRGDITKDEYDAIVSATAREDLPKAREFAKRVQVLFKVYADL